MSNDNVVSLAKPARVSEPLSGFLRAGARRLIEAAVSAEFEEYLSALGHEKLPDGRQRVVRNGHLPERKILTGLGEVDVRVPKARSRSGSPEVFRSSVVPPCVRRCASPDAAIPWLYLHRVSSGQIRQAVAALVGNQAAAVCRRTWSIGSSALGTRSTGSGRVGAWTTSGCTCGPTASKAAFVASASGCACWWSSASMPVAKSTSWLLRTAFASPPKVGPRCWWG